MIAFVKGELDTVLEDRIVVDNQGVGFEILVPMSVISELPPTGNSVKIYTYTHVKEDVLALYGFLTRDELEMFKLLITVNGIGPKGALSILSIMDADALRFAILSDDVKSIAKAPGVGAKTVGKLILELKDKCSLEDMLEPKKQKKGQENAGAMPEVTSDAIQALVALGYSSSEALSAVKKVEVTEGMTVNDILKASLKNI